MIKIYLLKNNSLQNLVICSYIYNDYNSNFHTKITGVHIYSLFRKIPTLTGKEKLFLRSINKLCLCCGGVFNYDYD